MGIIETVTKYLKPKAFDPVEGLNLENIGWHKVGGSSSYGTYKGNNFENAYPSISRLANSFALLEQYTVDSNDKKVESNILNRLYNPNTDMSAVDFREALAVTTMVHDRVRIRVHHTASSTKRINADNITGFTFLEGYTEQIVGGERSYQLPNGDDLSDDEVITLKYINPYAVTKGFAPAQAAVRWTTLDDYIADYQAGFFRNGAVPAGQFVITARSVADYNDIVDRLISRHQGASKQGSVTYAYRPTDANGSPLNSQVEWIPYSVQNKDMALKDLFDNVNKKIDSTYGVPEEIRGHLSNSNYASVAVAEKVFVKYALHPMALKIWTKFNHELNRITGGSGVAITFNLEIPVIADEEEVRARSQNVIATTIRELVLDGFTLETAVQYVKTNKPEVLVREEAVDDDVKPLNEEELKTSPDQPIDVYGKVVKSIDAKLTEILDTKLETKQLGEVDRTMYEYKMERIIYSQMERQVDKAIYRLESSQKALGDTTEEEDELFTDQVLTLMIPLMFIYGNKANADAMNLLVQGKLQTQSVKPFELTPAQRKDYADYISKLGASYNEQTAERIRAEISEGVLNGATNQQISQSLRNVLLGEENAYRVRRLAVTEVNTAGAKAGVYSMQNIKDQTGYTIQKRKVHFGSDAPCEFCASVISQGWTDVDSNYVDLGAIVEGKDGGVYENNWRDFDSGDLHANGHCGDEFRVKE
jgi:phage portal protein BeeE